MKRFIIFLSIIILIFLTTGELLYSYTGSLAGQRGLKITKTSHFDIIAGADCINSAVILIKYADDIYNELASKFHLKHDFHIPVVITSAVDKHNAYYSSAPFSHIVLYDTPESIEQVAFSEGFINTFRHELIHAITYNLHNAGWTGAKHVISDALNPALLTITQGFAEGATVSIESTDALGDKDTPQGRINSDYHLSILKQAKIDDKWPLYSEIQGAASGINSGKLPYYFGGAFNYYLQQKYGMDLYARFWEKCVNWKTATYFTCFKEVYGIGIKKVWDEFRDSVKIPFITKRAEQQNYCTLITPKKGIKHFDLGCASNDSYYYYDMDKLVVLQHNIYNSGKKNPNQKVIFAQSDATKISVTSDNKLLAISYSSGNYATPTNRVKIINCDTGDYYCVKDKHLRDGAIGIAGGKYYFAAVYTNSQYCTIRLYQIITNNTLNNLSNDVKSLTLIKEIAAPYGVGLYTPVITNSGTLYYIRCSNLHYTIEGFDIDGDNFYSVDIPRGVRLYSLDSLNNINNEKIITSSASNKIFLQPNEPGDFNELPSQTQVQNNKQNTPLQAQDLATDILSFSYTKSGSMVRAGVAIIKKNTKNVTKDDSNIKQNNVNNSSKNINTADAKGYYREFKQEQSTEPLQSINDNDKNQIQKPSEKVSEGEVPLKSQQLPQPPKLPQSLDNNNEPLQQFQQIHGDATFLLQSCDISGGVYNPCVIGGDIYYVAQYYDNSAICALTMYQNDPAVAIKTYKTHKTQPAIFNKERTSLYFIKTAPIKADLVKSNNYSNNCVKNKSNSIPVVTRYFYSPRYKLNYSNCPGYDYFLGESDNQNIDKIMDTPLISTIPVTTKKVIFNDYIILSQAPNLNNLNISKNTLPGLLYNKPKPPQVSQSSRVSQVINNVNNENFYAVGGADFQKVTNKLLNKRNAQTKPFNSFAYFFAHKGTFIPLALGLSMTANNSAIKTGVDIDIFGSTVTPAWLPFGASYITSTPWTNPIFAISAGYSPFSNSFGANFLVTNKLYTTSNLFLWDVYASVEADSSNKNNNGVTDAFKQTYNRVSGEFTIDIAPQVYIKISEALHLFYGTSSSANLFDFDGNVGSLKSNYTWSEPRLFIQNRTSFTLGNIHKTSSGYYDLSGFAATIRYDANYYQLFDYSREVTWENERNYHNIGCDLIVKFMAGRPFTLAASIFQDNAYFLDIGATLMIHTWDIQKSINVVPFFLTNRVTLFLTYSGSFKHEDLDYIAYYRGDKLIKTTSYQKPIASWAVSHLGDYFGYLASGDFDYSDLLKIRAAWALTPNFGGLANSKFQFDISVDLGYRFFTDNNHFFMAICGKALF